MRKVVKIFIGVFVILSMMRINTPVYNASLDKEIRVDLDGNENYIIISSSEIKVDKNMCREMEIVCYIASAPVKVTFIGENQFVQNIFTISDYTEVPFEVKDYLKPNENSGYSNGFFASGNYAYINKEGLYDINATGEYNDATFSNGTVVKVAVDEYQHFTLKSTFDGNWDFSEGLAAVRVGKQWGFIDNTGKQVIKPQFDEFSLRELSENLVDFKDAYSFKEGLAAVKKNNKWGFIDKTGKTVVSFQYDWVKAYNEGLAQVSKNGKIGFVDKIGNEVIKPQFEFAENFNEGYAVVARGKIGWSTIGKNDYGARTFHIDKLGKELTPQKFHYANRFQEGLAAVSTTDGKSAYIDRTGKEIIKHQYDSAGNFSEGLALVKKDEKYGFINKAGKEVIKPQFTHYVEEFNDGVARFWDGRDAVNGGWGLIDKTGKKIVGNIYSRLDDFQEGFALVSGQNESYGKYGFIDNTGKVVIKLQFDGAESFHEGLASVKVGSKWGLIDRAGLMIIEPKYDYISEFSDGFARVLINGKWGYIENPIGELGKYIDYKTGEYWSKDMLWAIENGLIKGYLNTTHPTTGLVGNWLAPESDLTEEQLLTVLFRYAKPDELKNTKPSDPSYWASVPYQLADKYKVPTKATLSNRAPASKVATRGTFAQALASVHLGRTVSEREAIDFMYEADISEGYADENGVVPKTYDSYRANNTLQRAHIVSFMKRYHDYLNK